MKRLFLLFALAALFAGCTKDEPFIPDNGKTQGGNPNAVSFSTTTGAPMTKAYTDKDFKSYFLPGDTIGVFAVNRASGSASLASTNNYAHNKAYVRQTDGTWKPATPADSIYYPGAGYVLDFYAYYPYINNANLNPLAVDFAVSTKQADTLNYNASDLMSGANTIGYGKANGSTPVSLTFTHRLALVEVEIHNDGGTGSQPDRTLSVDLLNFKPAAKFNLSSQTTTADAAATNIRMSRVEKEGTPEYTQTYTYRALVPAQTLANGTKAYGYTLNDAWYDYVLTAATEYKAAKAVRYRGVTPFTIPMVSIPLTQIPDGVDYYTFKMGTGPAQFDQMRHKVKLTKNFRMSKYQVTNAQWCAFLNAYNAANAGSEITQTDNQDKYNTDGAANATWFSLYSGASWIQIEYVSGKWQAKSGLGNRPFINVSHHGAKAFCDFYGFRLPTEAEWEYACRGGNGGNYSFSNANNSNDAELTDYAWFNINSGDTTHDVGTKKPNGFGLYDMHGNVLEWCADWYNLDYGISGINGNDIYSDPAGPATVQLYRVLRGGSWSDGTFICRSADRYFYTPDNRHNDNGFRVVLHF